MRVRSTTSGPVVAAVTVAMVMGLAGAAPAKNGKRRPSPAPAPTVTPAPPPPVAGGFCGYWGPNYSYTLPDGTVIRCG